MPVVSFDGTFAGWRAAARQALAEGCAPMHLVWHPATDAQHGLALDSASPNDASPHGVLTVPRRFLALATLVACHRDPERWATLYRVLWRLTRGEEPYLLAVAVDPDVLHLTRMAKAIKREIHKLHAFVRFRLVHAPDGVEEYIAWFEPEHDVVERAAMLFVRRFANMRWAVLTPHTSVRWDGVALVVGPGVPRHEAPSGDAIEQLWGTYYAHIFNPARVKLHAMRAEMPKRYWRNLPEAALITPLVRDAPARVRRMVEAAAVPRRASEQRERAIAPSEPPSPPARMTAQAAAPQRVGRALVYHGSSAWERDERTTGRPAAAEPVPDAAERLRRYAARYPLAVVESTAHRVFAPALATLLVSRAPTGLLFDVYAHSAMLGGAVRPHRLPRAIRELLPATLAGAERIAGEFVPAAVRNALWERFSAATEVLATHAALGAVLLRLPHAFGPTRERAMTVRHWLERLQGWPVGVEFGHPEWSSPTLRLRTAGLLAEYRATRVLRENEEGEQGEWAVVRGGEEQVARVAQQVERLHVLRGEG